MNTLIIETHSVEETQKWGEQIAENFKPGDIIGLIGNFGAGKTYLIKSICKYFGYSPHLVTSPSFTLIHEYHASEMLVHIDTYRLKNDIEFESLDIDYYLDQGAIILIEWADKIKHLLPDHCKIIEIEILDLNSRKISLTR